jgi:hypothetical protein
MSKLKSFLGYTIAALGLPIILATFMGMSFWAETLVSVTGVTISPWYTGGRVAHTIDHGTYHTDVHPPVFDALIGERKEGFVQVDWAPSHALPTHIDEEIDADGDGQMDFRIEVDTENNRATLTPHATWVLELEDVYVLQDALAIRVLLENPSR